MNDLINYINSFSHYLITSYTINEEDKLISINFQPLILLGGTCECIVSYNEIIFKTKQFWALNRYNSELILDLIKVDNIRKEIEQNPIIGIDINFSNPEIRLTFTDFYINKPLDTLVQLAEKLFTNIGQMWSGQGTFKTGLDKIKIIPSGRYINNIKQ